MTTQFGDLVDASGATISRRIFIESQFHEAELQQIFVRCWLFPCAYHGWTFGNDGEVTGAPNLREA
jgi:phenylpropionate dioxygenase-like ring-hydroxylating dioxygenase large terminal subunit